MHIDRSYCRVFSIAVLSLGLSTLPQIAQAEQSPVYRFYSSEYKSHFYTINDSEKSDLLTNNPSWRYEGITGEVETQNISGTIPLYRFWSSRYKSHFYTANPQERDKLMASDPNWNYEGIAYYVFSRPVDQSIAVYRFWSGNYRSHFYTSSTAERDNLQESDPNWSYEGIAYYAKPFSAGAGLVLRNNFESTSPGVYSHEQFLVDSSWPRVIWSETGNRASIVNVSGGGNKQLRMTYPSGAYGTTASGGQALIDLGSAYPDLYFRQSVRFEDGFDWQRGGKLPGLSSGGSKWSGGIAPRDGEGYSARYMWRDNGRAVLYLYHADQVRSYGDEIDLGLTFKEDIEYTLTQRIVRNSGDTNDGIVEVWASENGGAHRKLLSKNDVRFGMSGNGFTDSLYFSTYFGGGDQSWAPDKTSYIYFDDFIVTQSRFDDLP